MSRTGSLALDYGKLHYTVTGNGRKTLLAFHGFGQSCVFYSTLSAAYSSEYTFYCFDLPFHGESLWNSDPIVILDCNDLAQSVKTFLIENEINQFSLIGFSIGCRITQCLVNNFPSQIEQLVWVAPDGLLKNFWYELATGSKIGTFLFKDSIKNPEKYRTLLKICKSIGLLHSSTYQLVRSQLSNQARSEQVFNTWIAFQKLSVRVSDLNQLLNEHNIPLLVITGEKDHIIPTSKIRKKLSKLTDCKLEEIDSNHQYLLGKALAYIIDHKLLFN